MADAGSHRFGGVVWEEVIDRLTAEAVRLFASARLHVVMAERGHDVHPLPCSRDRHVQPALSSFTQKRSEPIQQLAGRVLSITDCQDNGVALVALHPFEVLDEKALVTIRCEKVV